MVYLCAVLSRSSCVTLCSPMDSTCQDSHGDSPDQNSRGGCHALFQGVFPSQGSNPGLPPCKWILYQLSRQGRPRTLEWVVCPFLRESSQLRNQTGFSCSPRTLEWVACPFPRGSSGSRSQTRVSFIARQILSQLSYPQGL